MGLQYKKQIAGGLEILEVPGKDPYGPHIVMLHGYGATALDLLPLSAEVKAPANTTWIFPNGPLSIPFGPSYVGKAWFPIDVEKLQQGIDFSQVSPPGLEEASTLIQGLLRRLPVPLDRIILGGFSQGAMLSCEVALQLKEFLGGLVVLSGTLLDEERWKELVRHKSGLPFYQSHGDHDDILRINYANRLESLFKEGGMQGHLHTFEGGHSIPEEVSDEMGVFVSNIFK